MHRTHLANCSRHIGRNRVKETITNTSLQTSIRPPLPEFSSVEHIPSERVAEPSSQMSVVLVLVKLGEVQVITSSVVTHGVTRLYAGVLEGSRIRA